MTWVGDAGQVGGAVGSAIAAIAAWRAVAGTRRAAEESLQPVLTGVVINNAPRDDDPANTPTLIGVELRNVGPNIAKRPGCWIAAFGSLLRAEYFGDGFLEPGATVDIVTPIVGPAKDGEAAAMFWCRDHRDTLHAWTHRGQHRVYRPRWRQEPWQVSVPYADMWRDFFPDQPSEDLRDLVDSPGRWQKRRATSHAPQDFNALHASPFAPARGPVRLVRRLRRSARALSRAWGYPNDSLPPAPPRDGR